MGHGSSKYLIRIVENSSSIRDLQPLEKARSSKTHRVRQYFDKTLSILLQSNSQVSYLGTQASPVKPRKLHQPKNSKSAQKSTLAQERYISTRKIHQLVSPERPRKGPLLSVLQYPHIFPQQQNLPEVGRLPLPIVVDHRERRGLPVIAIFFQQTPAFSKGAAITPSSQVGKARVSIHCLHEFDEPAPFTLDFSCLMVPSGFALPGAYHLHLTTEFVVRVHNGMGRHLISGGEVCCEDSCEVFQVD